MENRGIYHAYSWCIFIWNCHCSHLISQSTFWYIATGSNPDRNSSPCLKEYFFCIFLIKINNIFLFPTSAKLNEFSIKNQKLKKIQKLNIRFRQRQSLCNPFILSQKSIHIFQFPFKFPFLYIFPHTSEIWKFCTIKFFLFENEV